ncbi:hypothetical protein PybrP1_005814, partial [[Pythium] brassicae (nom. inval.)]
MEQGQALPLMQPPRASAAKSLKHKSKSGKRIAGGKSDDALRELLAGKIAELQVGGDENLETPIDLSGVFLDDALPARTRVSATRVFQDAELSAEQKAEALAAQVQAARRAGADAAEDQRDERQVHSAAPAQEHGHDGADENDGEQGKDGAALSGATEAEQVHREREPSHRGRGGAEAPGGVDALPEDDRRGEREDGAAEQRLRGSAARERKQLEAKDLTVQLAEAKLQHQVELTAREAERVKMALEKATEFSERGVRLQASPVAQLNAYSERFDIAQETLTKTNDVFAVFRDEMDKMSKHAKKLEKENAALQKKCAAYDLSAIATVEEKLRAAEDAKKQLEKIRKLESLCRQLQAERHSARDEKQVLPESARRMTLADSISEEQTRQQRAVLHARKQIGGMDAPMNYAASERVFGASDTPPAKALAKQEVLESLKSRILSSEPPGWNASTSNYDNMQMTGKCYKRTNVNAERNRMHMYVYNFRAEKLPEKYPTLKPKTNRFNTGILEVALKDEYVGETFGDERMARGISKRTEELPSHPDLRDATPWDLSSELTPATRREHFLKIEAERAVNSTKWKQKVAAPASNYKAPEQLVKEANERLRQQKEAERQLSTRNTPKHQAATMAAPTPPESLVLYGDPIFTGETLDPSKRAGGSAPVGSSDGIGRIEDILNAILPPQMWREEKTGYWMRYAAPTPSTRFDVIKLQEEMDARLMRRQARESGICPVREDVYRQCFDELIREVAINSPERGLLLLRVRDEIRLTTDAYKTLYDSSITFGIRKQLQAEEGMGDLQARIEQLQRDKLEGESKVLELSSKLELIEKRATERKALQDKKCKEEIDFLKYQGQHLDAFLKSAGGGGAGAGASTSG